MEVNDRVLRVAVGLRFKSTSYEGACVVQFQGGTYGDLVQLRCLDGEYKWLPVKMVERYCSEPHWVAEGRAGVAA